MKKVLFICAVAVLSCSACDWFGSKPANNDTDQTLVTTDSLSNASDTAVTETPAEAEQDEKDEKDSQ